MVYVIVNKLRVLRDSYSVLGHCSARFLFGIFQENDAADGWFWQSFFCGGIQTAPTGTVQMGKDRCQRAQKEESGNPAFVATRTRVVTAMATQQDLRHGRINAATERLGTYPHRPADDGNRSTVQRMPVTQGYKRESAIAIYAV
jgi:hypothetical protein